MGGKRQINYQFIPTDLFCGCPLIRGFPLYIYIYVLFRYLTSNHIKNIEYSQRALVSLQYIYNFFNLPLICKSMVFLIFWSGSFAAPIGDHLRSGIICGPGIICEPVKFSDNYSNKPHLLRDAFRSPYHL